MTDSILSIDYKDYLKDKKQHDMVIPPFSQRLRAAAYDSHRSRSTQEVPSSDQKRLNYFYQRCNPNKETIPNNSIAFTRDERFRSQMSTQIQDTPLSINKNIGFRSTGVKFGLTKRSQFYLNIIKQARQTPSPFDYFRQEGSQIKVKKCAKCKSHLNRSVQADKSNQNCCTFGNSFAKYRKQGSFDVKLFQNEENPGIGQYNANYDAVSKNTQNCIIASRRQDLSQFSATQDISPMTYAPKYTQVLVDRNQNPHMGLGNKLDLGKPLNFNPGPGYYKLDQLNTLSTKSQRPQARPNIPFDESQCHNKICTVTRREFAISQQSRRRPKKNNQHHGHLSQ